MASRLAQATLEDAPDGATRGWTNPQTGNRGEITPLRTYVSERGYFCRDYREELAVAGEEGRFYHTACRDDAAGWTWLWGSAAARSAGAVRGDLSRCSIHEVDARAKTPEQVADSSH